METLTQIKDRVAQKHGFDDWKDLVLKWRFNSTLKPIDLTVIVDQAMQEYAKTQCIRQKANMITLVRYIATNCVLQRLATAPLATEE